MILHVPSQQRSEKFGGELVEPLSSYCMIFVFTGAHGGTPIEAVSHRIKIFLLNEKKYLVKFSEASPQK